MCYNIYNKKCVFDGVKNMGKIKQYMLERKARKELGEEKYYALREEFLRVFNEVCMGFGGDASGKAIVREMKALKDKMWMENLFKILGTAMLVVSIWRSDIYSARDTFVGCATGVILASVAKFKNMYTNRSYNDATDELIDYVTTKVNKLDNVSLAEGFEGNQETLRVVYKDACDDLVY